MSKTASPMFRAMAAAVRANVPVAITGAPGEGKTATFTDAISDWGYHTEVVVGSNREASDFLGVMVEDKGVVHYSSFRWVKELNVATKGLLLLDEFNTSSPSTMKGMLRVVQERYVGDEKLGDHVSIVALMNPVETAVDAYDLPAPMANRMMHLNWKFDASSWLENVGTGFKHATIPSLNDVLNSDPVAGKARTSAWVTTFLRGRSTLLNPGAPEDPVKAGGAWASPRSWTNAIDVAAQLERTDTEALFLVIAGCVGEGIATEFIAWVGQNDLYDPIAVMSGQKKVNWGSERVDRLFVLMQSMTTLALVDDQLWTPAVNVFVDCAQNGRPDVAAPGAQKLMNNIPAGKRMPQAFRDEFAELFAHTIDKVRQPVAA